MCTSLIPRTMNVAFGLGMRLHVHMHTNFENGILHNGQWCCEWLLSTRVNLKLWRRWVLVKLDAVIPNLLAISTWYLANTTQDAQMRCLANITLRCRLWCLAKIDLRCTHDIFTEHGLQMEIGIHFTALHARWHLHSLALTLTVSLKKVDSYDKHCIKPASERN